MMVHWTNKPCHPNGPIFQTWVLKQLYVLDMHLDSNEHHAHLQTLKKKKKKSSQHPNPPKTLPIQHKPSQFTGHMSARYTHSIDHHSSHIFLSFFLQLTNAVYN